MYIETSATVVDKTAIRHHLQLLGHNGYGATELRVFDPKPMVAYIDNDDDAIRLVADVQRTAKGIYIGVQPRPLFLFDKSPHRWTPAVSKPVSNCGKDADIEYITILYFDIDVNSEQRKQGYPASDKELELTLHAAQLLSREDGLALTPTICCSGNGHYVITPIEPIPISDNEVPHRFRHFCQELAKLISCKVPSVKIDPVYNLSRVMRLMGTMNRKGQPMQDRPHRQAFFATEPVFYKSMAAHYMILNTDVPYRHSNKTDMPSFIKCNLDKIEECHFIKWCRQSPDKVTEPQWFAMIANMAKLEGGPKLIHEMSVLDKNRYSYDQTQRRIERVLNNGYSPTSCESIAYFGFKCPKLGQCLARAPMYMTTLFSIWNR